MYEKYLEFKKDPLIMNKVYSGKIEMAKGFYLILLCYIQHFRAFNFREPAEESKDGEPSDTPVWLDKILA